MFYNNFNAKSSEIFWQTSLMSHSYILTQYTVIYPNAYHLTSQGPIYFPIKVNSFNRKYPINLATDPKYFPWFTFIVDFSVSKCILHIVAKIFYFRSNTQKCQQNITKLNYLLLSTYMFTQFPIRGNRYI